MKKKKKNNIFKIVFYALFLSFLVVYFSELTGYYEYQNNEKKSLTEKQIKQFENDVKNGKEVDINKYLVVNEINYDNKLSKLNTRLSDGLSNIVEKGVEYSFKYLSKLVDE